MSLENYIYAAYAAAGCILALLVVVTLWQYCKAKRTLKQTGGDEA
jgi:hypothetical protein